MNNESNNDDTNNEGSRGSDLLGHDGCGDDLLDGRFIDDDITSSLGTENPTALALLDNFLAQIMLVAGLAEDVSTAQSKCRTGTAVVKADHANKPSGPLYLRGVNII